MFPAARVGDMTMHPGGVVIPPGAGLPPSPVLIQGMPAARVGDFHTCPMVTGVVPHVGGPITMGSPTVLIGGLPASRVFDIATCVGPPDGIKPPGAQKTLIGYGSAPGPVICTVVGNPARGYELHPGRQNYQNCYPQSIQQIVHQGFGANHSEGAMEGFASPHGYNPSSGTPGTAGPNILQAASAGTIRGTIQSGGAEAAARALEQNRGVIGLCNSSGLWNNASATGRHAVHVTGALRDQSGRVIGVIFNDTGRGTAGIAGQAISAAQFNRASIGSLVTNTSIW